MEERKADHEEGFYRSQSEENRNRAPFSDIRRVQPHGVGGPPLNRDQNPPDNNQQN